MWHFSIVKFPQSRDVIVSSFWCNWYIVSWLATHMEVISPVSMLYPFKSNLHVVYTVEFLRKKNPVSLPTDMLLAMFWGNKRTNRDQHQKDFYFYLKSNFNRFLFYLNFLLHFLSIFYPVVILQENRVFFFSKTGAGWRCCWLAAVV